MDLTEALHSLGIAALYIGFASGIGFAARQNKRDRYRGWERALVVTYGCLFMLPSSVFILHYESWVFLLRIAVILIGILTLVLTLLRPTWLPTRLWSRTISQRYAALSMGIIFVWCVLAWRTQMDSAVLALGLSACVAALSSLKSSLHPA